MFVSKCTCISKLCLCVRLSIWCLARVHLPTPHHTHTHTHTHTLQRTLHHGNEVVLYSRSSEKTLRIKDDKTVEGRGGEGALGTHTYNHSHTTATASESTTNTCIYSQVLLAIYTVHLDYIIMTS